MDAHGRDRVAGLEQNRNEDRIMWRQSLIWPLELGSIGGGMWELNV
jgi:hypothetical protein